MTENRDDNIPSDPPVRDYAGVAIEDEREGRPSGKITLPDPPFTDPRLRDLIASVDDLRTSVNTMRHNYRKLSDDEKMYMELTKDLGLAFLVLLHRIGGSFEELSVLEGPTDVKQRSRELALAQTKVEEAVMWAVKHITR